MEETLGYDSLFSPDEWDAIERGDWSGIVDPALQADTGRHVARRLG